VKGRVWRIALALGASLLAAGFAVACNDDGADDEAPAQATVDPAVLLADAAARMTELQSFHFLLEHENGATEIVFGFEMERAEGDVAGTDSIQAEIRGSRPPLPTDLEAAIVILPSGAWFRDPLIRRWNEVDISIDAVFDPASGVPALIESATAPAIDGREEIDGVETYRIEATVDSGDLTIFSKDAEPGRALRARAWIGVDDPLVYRLEVTGPVAPGDDDDIVRRLTLSRFDEPVVIEEPD
jgi:hypothetical protein